MNFGKVDQYDEIFVSSAMTRQLFCVSSIDSQRKFQQLREREEEKFDETSWKILLRISQ